MPNRDFQTLRSGVSPVLDGAARLCRAAQADLASWAQEEKSDRSPVTVADLGVQAVVTRGLGRLAPELPLVAEEDAALLKEGPSSRFARAVCDHVTRIEPGMASEAVIEALEAGSHRGDAPAWWLLDPIDGTKGFLRNDQYAIALALVEDGVPVFGALACPSLADAATGRTGTLLCAGRGEGAFHAPLGPDPAWRPAHVSAERVLAALRLVESVERAHSAHDASARVRERLGIAAEPVHIDSQCKYAVLARGDAEVYLRLPTRPGYVEKAWDHAAGALIVSEAGGRVTDVSGAPLDFSHGPRLEQNRGIVATHGPHHDQVLAAVRTALSG